MKRKKNKCPLVPPNRNDKCPLEGSQHSREQPSVLVVRTERRSWITLAITGFGALLLRYLKTVRERGQTVRGKKP